MLTRAVFGQYSRGAWTSFGGDPQRTGWNKIETEITPHTAPKLKLEWSIKLDNAPIAMNGLTAPLARAQLYTAKGVRDLTIVAGSSDKLFVIDADTGKMYWQKTLGTEGKPLRASTWLCPNALTATPMLGPAPAGSGSSGQALYVLASDGRLHAFNLVSGEDLIPPTQFVPPFAKMWSLNEGNGMLYSTTSQGCNGVASGVYGMDLSNAERKIPRTDLRSDIRWNAVLLQPGFATAVTAARSTFHRIGIASYWTRTVPTALRRLKTGTDGE